MERSARIQQFYIENRVIEYTLSFEEVCALMNAMSSKLKVMAQMSTDLTLVFSMSPSINESSVHEDVLVKRVAVCLECSTVPSGSHEHPNYEFDPLWIVNEYFNI